MHPPSIRKTLLASSLALALCAPSAQAALVTDIFGPFHNWTTDRANFTMLDGGGYTVGGTNDIAMLWDGNAYNASSDYTGPGGAANVTLSSTTPFFGHTWAAHDIQMFMPGSYSFDASAGGDPSDTETGFLNVTVGTGQIGMHMLFDWKARNIDMFVVFSLNSTFGSGIARSSNTSGCDFTAAATVPNCLWDGPGYVGGFSVGGLSANKPAGSTVWMMASVDGNGDGVMGIPMASGGPFQGFNANFNTSLNVIECGDCPPPPEVPVPTAVWLLGSGLLGLLGIARRRRGVRHH
ncbi:hypothetical protein SCL_1584 [Sulfuricaulis limicola]|uniref:PEP-CTERM protein-sorting domain-containing protein n=1 Tax=Sulfuricaulis limicola TaxID=1620215 RepID=A0A1B4XGI6_9GAMM|nr:hypothetical protein [Sulfuricaulis limicola]BAV33889.1 hypothetical protein SCL_1584 [Sulfuricaulis limicola]